MKSAMLKIK